MKFEKTKLWLGFLGIQNLSLGAALVPLNFLVMYSIKNYLYSKDSQYLFLCSKFYR